MNLQIIDKWHKTKTGYIVFGLAELGILLFLLAVAENSGSLLQYAVVLFLGIGVLQNFGKLIVKVRAH